MLRQIVQAARLAARADVTGRSNDHALIVSQQGGRPLAYPLGLRGPKPHGPIKTFCRQIRQDFGQLQINSHLGMQKLKISQCGAQPHAAKAKRRSQSNLPGRFQGLISKGFFRFGKTCQKRRSSLAKQLALSSGRNAPGRAVKQLHAKLGL